MEFSGKRVLVTGSTRGIGRAAAALFAERGGEVIVHGRKAPEAHRVAAELSGRAIGLGAELSRRDECRRLAAEVGEVDILVNCAGIFLEAPIAQIDEDFWDRTMAVNLTAPWALSKALLPALGRKRGVIVNVASDAALLGYAGSTAYCASKGALIGLTKAMAVELAPDIRVIAICPGPVETDMMGNSLEASPDPAAAREFWIKPTLLRRVARPEEIAEAIVFAASPRASYMTGDLLLVDGGTTAGRRVVD